MAYDNDLHGLNFGGLRISSRAMRQRTPMNLQEASWPSTPSVTQKMDVCSPEKEAPSMKAEKTQLQHAHVDTQCKINRPLDFRARVMEMPPHRDLQIARKLYVLPYFLSGYLQLILNVVVVAFSVYAMWCFYSTIRDDIDTKVQLFSEEVMQTMTKCSKDYRENKCDPELRVPAMAALCRTWEHCMQQDPMTVATRAKFSAETMGEGLNAFFEKITWKTIACMCFLLFGFLISYNVAFYFAARQNPERMHPNWDHAPMGYYRSLPPAQVPPLADANYCYAQQRSLW